MAANDNNAEALEKGSAKEIERARELAARYGVDYLDPDDFHLDGELFDTIPAKLMYRYNFVPLWRDDGVLTVVMADPSDVMLQDEMELALGTAIRVVVGTPSFITDILKKSESSQRVLEEATEGFQPRVIEEDEDVEKSLSIESLEEDESPIIRLVDSAIFTGIQRRASDIHLETREGDLVVKYRIDGALYHAQRDPQRGGQDHHHRGPRRVPARGHHPDPGEREEGSDLRPRPAPHPAPRPRQDHGG